MAAHHHRHELCGQGTTKNTPYHSQSEARGPAGSGYSAPTPKNTVTGWTGRLCLYPHTHSDKAVLPARQVQREEGSEQGLVVVFEGDGREEGGHLADLLQQGQKAQ